MSRLLPISACSSVTVTEALCTSKKQDIRVSVITRAIDRPLAELACHTATNSRMFRLRTNNTRMKILDLYGPRYRSTRSKCIHCPPVSCINHHNLDSCPSTTLEPSIATAESEEGFSWLLRAAGTSASVERTDSLKKRDGWAQE
jgi:hypothetical protein